MAEGLTHTAGSVEAAAREPVARPASPPGYELIDEVGRGGMGVACGIASHALLNVAR